MCVCLFLYTGHIVSIAVNDDSQSVTVTFNEPPSGAITDCKASSATASKLLVVFALWRHFSDILRFEDTSTASQRPKAIYARNCLNYRFPAIANNCS